MDHLEYKIEMRGPLFQTKITFFQAVILQPDQSLIIFTFPASQPAKPAIEVRLRPGKSQSFEKHEISLNNNIRAHTYCCAVGTIIMFVLTGN